MKREIVKKLGIQSTYSPLLSSREYLLQYEPTADDLPARSMQDSFTSAIIPLSTDVALQDKYVTILGHVRLGRLMEDMDLFAGECPKVNGESARLDINRNFVLAVQCGWCTSI